MQLEERKVMETIERAGNQRVKTTAPRRLLALFLAATLVFTMLPISGIFGGTNVAEAATNVVKSTYIEATYWHNLDHVSFYSVYPKPASWPKDGGYDVSYYISKVQSYYNNNLVRTLYFNSTSSTEYKFSYKERNRNTRFAVTFTKRWADDPGPASFTDNVTVKIAKGEVFVKAKTKRAKVGKRQTLKFSVKGGVYTTGTYGSEDVNVTKGKVTLKVGKKTYKGKLKKGVATFKKVYVKRSSTFNFKLKSSNYWKNTSKKFLIF
jgi:hypothetical protein